MPSPPRSTGSGPHLSRVAFGTRASSLDVSLPIVREAGFLPRRIAPRLDSAVIADFAEADSACLSDSVRIDVSDHQWAEFVSTSCLEWGCEASRLERSLASLARPLVASFGHSVSALKRGNAVLVGSRGPESEFRSSAVWVGRVSQSESAWLGSPPKKLQMLMQQWQSLDRLVLPETLKLAIATARLLQIHPFCDGNGRTARWYGLLFVNSRLKRSRRAAEQLTRFWQLPSSTRHAASHAACSDDDWGLWLGEWIGTI
jgi:hypothetical protein